MIKNFFTGKDGKYVVFQWPNPPLYLWLVSALIASFSQGNIQAGFSSIAAASIFAWAYLEITDGESPFRRLLGIIVMAVSIYGFFAV